MSMAASLTVRWRGVPPARPLREALGVAGISIDTGGRGAAPVATVIATARSGRVPRGPAGGERWLWVSAGAIAAAAADQAARAGAYDAIPLGAEGARAELARRLRELGDEEPPVPATPGIIAESPVARELLRRVWRAARTRMPLLLTGETGTGKEVLAGLVHRWSERRGAYIPINCAAIPNELMESELFGHTRGAFSGAVASVDGKLLAARAGTVFLDEIDDTPLSIQAKLLRVLEDGAVTRIGEAEPRPADFRLIAASNRNLLRLVDEGKFGLDFYERLAIVRLELPPLRQRRADIPAFVRHFVARFFESQGLPATVRGVSERALTALVAHDWPGNIRELRNVVYQALVAKRPGSDELLLSDVRALLDARQGSSAPDPVVSADAIRAQIAAGTFNLRRELRVLETTALAAALGRAGGRAAAAARLLGEVGRGKSADPGGTIRAMARRLGITR
jgi:DNA-binding NtrC family response regulator